MNIETNGLADAVTVIAKAAGEQEGSATLYLHPRNKGAHAIGTPPSDDGLERIEVPVVRVETALGELGLSAQQIGLIWIDAEGHEPQIIRGLGRLLDARVPIAFEFAPRRYDPAARRALIDLLAARYTTLHSLNAAPDHRAPIAALADIGEMDDVLVF
jgi:FkbM family methyltransferase